MKEEENKIFTNEETSAASLKKKLAEEKRHDFLSLCQLTALLRSPEGCPWDIEQTHRSIRSSLIEETYEVVEAIDLDDPKLMREELGDLLFQVMFHSDIERTAGRFDISDVIHDVCAKMILRHPHVFGSGDADTPEKVLDAWEKIKKEEKSRLTLRDEMEAVPKMLPALMRCQKVAGKALKQIQRQESGEAADENGEGTALPAYAARCGESLSEEALVETIFSAAVELKKRGVNAEEKLTELVNAFIAEVAR